MWQLFVNISFNFVLVVSIFVGVYILYVIIHYFKYFIQLVLSSFTSNNDLDKSMFSVPLMYK